MSATSATRPDVTCNTHNLRLRKHLSIRSIRSWISRRSNLWWSWSVRPSGRRCGTTTSTQHIWLTACLLLLQCRCSRFYQSVLDAARNVDWEHRSGVQGAWYGLFPGLEHLIQFSPCLLVDECVCIHKCLIEVPAQKQSVGSPYIFHNRVDYIQSR